jgi:hypothetical protein
MSKIARTAVIVALAGIASTATAGPLPGFTLKAETSRFLFYARDGRKIDVSRTERFLEKLERLLGQRVEGRVEYYRHGSPEEIAAFTGTYAAGLTSARQIHSTQEFHAHEIVHLVAGGMGDPGGFFHEGLAVALGNEGKWHGKDVDALARRWARANSLSRLVAAFDRMDPQESYPVAGSFVGRLIEVHGIGKVAEFFRAAKGASATAAFEATFGTTLDEAGREWAQRL